jgi:hypothetical protein
MRLGRASTVTNAQREELWRRYKAGETILGIGRTLGQRRPTSSGVIVFPTFDAKVLVVQHQCS